MGLEPHISVSCLEEHHRANRIAQRDAGEETLNPLVFQDHLPLKLGNLDSAVVRVLKKSLEGLVGAIDGSLRCHGQIVALLSWLTETHRLTVHRISTMKRTAGRSAYGLVGSSLVTRAHTSPVSSEEPEPLV